MDFVEINRFTQEKKVNDSRNALYGKNLGKVDALRLVVYALKRMYGINNTSKILHAIGVKKIDLSI